MLALFASAWLHALAETLESHLTATLLQIHQSFGVTIWLVTALRLAWRLTGASLPPFPTQMSNLHRATVKLTEYGLYALLLVQPATGLITTLFAGRPFALFLWQFPAVMPRDEILRAAFHLSHVLGAWALALLAVYFVLRDDVLECMAPVFQQHVPGRSSQGARAFRPETHSGNKSDPLAILLARHGNAP